MGGSVTGDSADVFFTLVIAPGACLGPKIGQDSSDLSVGFKLMRVGVSGRLMEHSVPNDCEQAPFVASMTAVPHAHCQAQACSM